MHDLPLDGVVAVELSDSASAPFAGQILAALGADVWKIERPSGDSARGWGPSKWKGSGAAFHAINRGKRFISLDIKDPGDLAKLHQLIAERAHVFFHNLRPGHPSKLNHARPNSRDQTIRKTPAEPVRLAQATPM